MAGSGRPKAEGTSSRHHQKSCLSLHSFKKQQAPPSTRSAFRLLLIVPS